ncbi:MAG: hypothetical protein IPH07_03030 [Deltaproteobacteria bacterium]|nr:hypothetical protein [Deltaproteobacteria bacterium]MBK8238013.1 hypothetical protein [Deltaproteobacteria bacterium]MBK8718644.1 hypothetical protein [Deltaproteobacteria bacterium]MBP7291243.1 hypothetical protein [Nannocystaceae bacterium]
MAIREIELWPLRIPFRGSFGHAASTRDAGEPVLVRLVDEAGRQGWGEALPRPYVTGEDVGSVLDRDGPAIASRLRALDLDDVAGTIAWLRRAIDEHVDALAAFGAFELALLDLVGQRAGVSLLDLLGGAHGAALPAGIVIGFEVATDKLARHCAALRFGGRRHVKVKIGADDDEARLAIIAGVLKDLPLRLDANAAWSAQEAIARLSGLTRFAIASVEQPVGKHDLAGLRRIRRELGLRVMADESVCSLDDARRLVEAEACDIFNVRLGKMGGALGAARICAFAATAGVALHLGTMVGETGVLSVASERFGQATPGFDCLDGKGQNAFLLAEDILEPDVEISASAPGLGLRVSEARVRAHAIAPVRRC